MRWRAAAAKPRGRSAGSGGFASRASGFGPSAGAVTSCWSLARKAWRPLRSLISLRSPDAVEHAVGQGLLVGERVQHAVLDGVLGDQVDDRDRAGLVLAPGAGDALFELGRVPGQVAVDDDAGVLEVQARRAGIGAEEDAAVRVGLEGVDLGAAALLRDAAGVPGEAELEPAAQARAPARASAPIRRRR